MFGRAYVSWQRKQDIVNKHYKEAMETKEFEKLEKVRKEVIKQGEDIIKINPRIAFLPFVMGRRISLEVKLLNLKREMKFIKPNYFLRQTTILDYMEYI